MRLLLKAGLKKNLKTASNSTGTSIFVENAQRMFIAGASGNFHAVRQ
jgi:hypothetical protein